MQPSASQTKPAATPEALAANAASRITAVHANDCITLRLLSMCL